MRKIDMVYLEIIDPSEFPDLESEWIDSGMVFAPYHFRVYFHGPKEDMSFERGRPLCLPNGLFPEEYIRNRSIGIVVEAEDRKMSRNKYEQLAMLIKNVTMDIGVKEFYFTYNLKDKKPSYDMQKIYGLSKSYDGDYRRYSDMEYICSN